MNFQHLPDDILLNIFQKYLNLNQLLCLSYTCERFNSIINCYNLWDKYLKTLPIVDFSYPNGYSQLNQSLVERSNRYKLQLYSKWNENKQKKKLIYIFNEKMLPHVQVDDQESCVYVSEANELVSMKLKDIKNYNPSKFHVNKLTQKSFRTNQIIKNDIKINSKFKIFEEDDDINKFIKKDNLLVSITKNKVSTHLFLENNKSLKLFELEEQSNNNKINCVDFSSINNRLITGSSNGILKIYDIRHETINQDLEPLNCKNVQDRILRCILSPNLNQIAIGTAGVRPFLNEPSPMRIYDLESLKELQILKPPKKAFMHGAGILALSYIDENTLMGSGYDTFIRIFDLRSNQCVQEIEEPEDMSIYCVCTSKSYGLLSGNDRQSIIRYFDRRKARLITSYTASSTNSSIYSLSCTPEFIFAAWDRGITVIDFS